MTTPATSLLFNAALWTFVYVKAWPALRRRLLSNPTAVRTVTGLAARFLTDKQ